MMVCKRYFLIFWVSMLNFRGVSLTNRTILGIYVKFPGRISLTNRTILGIYVKFPGRISLTNRTILGIYVKFPPHIHF